jgi:ABC-type tungstate transport system substrate-binding protein
MSSGGEGVVGTLGVVDEEREVADVVLNAREVDEGVVGLEERRTGLNGMMIVSFGRAFIAVCAAIFVTCCMCKW